MTEHEKLKWINDTIGYTSTFEYKPDRFNAGLYIGYIEQVCYELRVVDVREIIYTQEFMYKFTKYHGENIATDDLYETKMLRLLFNHLDDPVSYLYNLLGGPTNK